MMSIQHEIRRGTIRRALCVWLTIAALFTATPLPGAQAEDTATLTATVILRKSADKKSKALQTLPEGDEVTLLNESGSWYKVSYGKYSGYIMKKYAKASISSATANKSKIAELGDAPGAMRIGDNNKDVKKLQSALKILGYYSGKLDGDYGSGTTEAVTAYQKAKGLTADGVAGKTTVKAIFGSCAKTSLSDSGSADQSADAAKTDANAVSSIEEIGDAPATSREGDSGTKVKKLQQALKLLGYYTGEIDSSYGAQTVAAVKKFQKNRGMTQDGIAGASTIRVLFGASAANADQKTYKTEVLDWFKDNVSSVIPKNASFTVKDVRTGKTFTAVRWSGVNHLDAEPKTSDDTAAMKSIYGGAWSWNRRPILILYNGHVYAASMNGMPHGTTTRDNGFDGHFCIHFKNSMTHGTKKVDAAHQSCVTTASKATW